MGFYQQLQETTARERESLLQVPLIGRALRGEIDLPTYVAFLTEAYHHVKHTVPLLMSVGGRLSEKHEWLRKAIAEYIEEEYGHQEWILNDIAACGGDKESVRNGRPSLATELLVSYAYDTVHRVNPVGFFGMVLVLEGTSVTVATEAARCVQQALSLPSSAFSYLTSHGSLDQSHIRFFESLMDQVTDSQEQSVIVHAARIFYRLYADVLKTPTGHAWLADTVR